MRKKNSGHGSVLNQDLWVALDEAIAPHTATFEWVKGHGDHNDNIRCDKLATAEAKKYARLAFSDVEPSH